MGLFKQGSHAIGDAVINVQKTALLVVTGFICVAMLNTSVADAGGGLTNIKVHGDWEITVREPDGELVSQVRFKNAFVGDLQLRGLLKRSVILSPNENNKFWGIAFSYDNYNPSDECAELLRDDALNTELLNDPGLISLERTVQVPAECINVELREDFNVSQVRSVVRVSNLDGSLVNHHNFTRKILEVPVNVALGQLVTFKVDISFE